jgi:uncharacterized membrane protein YkgB
MHTTILPLATIDQRFTRWLARHGLLLLRLSVGVVFLWFGALKFFPGLSPAEDLAARTINLMTLGAMPASVSLPILATWEVMIGCGFLSGRYMRVTLLLLVGQMAGTVTPLIMFPHETFTAWLFAPTLEGQYIIKNIVLVSAGLVLGAVVRGGLLIADPAAARTARRKEDRTAQPRRGLRSC